MNICFIYYKYPLYSKGSYFQEFLNKLAGGVREIYLIASPYPRCGFAKPENISIFWVPLLRLRYLDEVFFMFACLFRAIFTRELKYIDLVNSIGPRGLLAGLYLKARYRVPLICTIEMLNEKGGFYNTLYYYLVRFLITSLPIDRFICWSNYYWDRYLRRWGISEEKVDIIPCGIDIDIYNPNVDGTEIKNRYAPNMPLIVFAKPLYRENTESAKILVQVVSLLKRKVKLLIGSGEGKPEVEALARRLGIGDLVDFMPPTDFPDIPRYIAASDLIVLPFIYSPTTSRSLLEAMAMGKPIVTVPVGEVKDILTDGVDAIFVDRSPPSIAQAVEMLLGERVLRERIGNNALRLTTERFSQERIVAQYIGVYRKMIDE